MRRAATGLALAVLVAGCSAGEVRSAASPPPTGESSKAKEQRKENLRATCMKGKGFTYIPWIFPDEPVTDEELKASSGDYEALKAERSRRGFGMYYSMVNTKDEKGKETMIEDPNNKITAKLSKTQVKAWTKANTECYVQVAKTVYDKVVKDESDLWSQYWEMSKKALSRELDGDAELVDLAQKFGDCLKSKGYKVTSLRPTELNERGRNAIQEEMTELAQKQQGRKEKMDPGTFMMPELSQQDARPYLQREIKAALDDLECGKDFYAAFMPRRTTVSKRVSVEFGLGSTQ
ncbi:hypothetical protein ACIBG8_48250 [Nonomuraea sp. NPDC050556]|uniref:hypothetical protein n=1 Tax=Nonomuraea sp. NPDC050556 TaxID=3364369 RepID=UPI0037B56C17